MSEAEPSERTDHRVHQIVDRLYDERPARLPGVVADQATVISERLIWVMANRESPEWGVRAKATVGAVVVMAEMLMRVAERLCEDIAKAEGSKR